MGIHIGETYHDVSVVLDGNTYNDCIFTRCNMSYSGVLPVGLVGCTFSECEWAFNGPALETMKFLGNLAAMGGGAKEMVETTFNNILADNS